MMNHFFESVPNKRQHTAPAALDSQQVARLCGGSYELQQD